MIARVAVAGALTAIPLAAVSIPAMADTPAGPNVTAVNRPHWDDRDDWNNPWDRDNWRDRHDNWDNRNQWDRDPLRSFLRQWVPTGSFGSR